MSKISLGSPFAWVFAMSILCALGASELLPAQCLGAPQLSAPGNYTPFPGASLSRVLAVDLDNDNALDLVALDGFNQLMVLRNNGLGVFQLETVIALPERAISVIAADFDQDGRADLALVGTWVGVINNTTQIQARITVMLNRTSPSASTVTFAPPIVIPVGVLAMGGSVGRALACADLNADGILDLVMADSNSTHAWVLLGNGTFGIWDGTFAQPVAYGVNATNDVDVVIADFDQDGAPDIALVHAGGSIANSFVSRLNGVVGPNGRPTGTFTNAGQVIIPGPATCTSIIARDFNADGVMDIAVTSSNAVDVAFGVGGGLFTPMAVYPGGFGPSQIATGDFSSDGLLDIAVADLTTVSPGFGNFSLLVSQGASFASYTNYTPNFGLPVSVATGDFNGDGLADAAIGKSIGDVTIVNGMCFYPITQAVNVVYPNGGESFGDGAIVTVAWSKTASIAAVDVDVSRDNGVTWRTIATDVTTLSTPWRVTAPGSARSLIRVRGSGILGVNDVSDSAFSIVAPGLAAVTTLGAGCAVGPPPTLTVSAPTLGLPIVVLVSGAAPNSVVGLFVSAPPAAPTTVAPGCAVYVDPFNAILLAQTFTDTVGSLSPTYSVPADLGFVGVAVRVQAAILTPGIGPGFELTNGVALQLGL